MTKRDPNIVGNDLAKVRRHQAPSWRYKFEQTGDMRWASWENRWSDNDGHRDSFPIPEPTENK
jgi:hypothetical protein